MRREITLAQLWLIENDIASIKETMPALYLVNETKFNNILNGSANKMHWKVLHTRMAEIQKKYIQLDDQGKPKKNDGGNWVFLESALTPDGQLVTGEDLEPAYLKEAGDFLARSVTIEF